MMEAPAQTLAVALRRPGTFALWSLLLIFWFQALLLWAISTPLYQAQRPGPASVSVFDVLGLVLFVVGFTFEAGGDWQLARFKADPANEGQAMDRGFWLSGLAAIPAATRDTPESDGVTSGTISS